MKDICSIWAYEDIINSGYLGKRQARVLSIFSSDPNKAFTGTEIAEIMGRGYSENTRNRITELDQIGFIERVDMTEDLRSGQVVNRWRYTGRRKPKKFREEEVSCSRCKGSGKIIEKIYYEDLKGDLFNGR